MNLRFSFLILGSIWAAACALPMSAHAQAGAACDPQSHNTDSRNACAIQRFQAADTAQNILYSDVMRALSSHERPALRKDQTLWMRLRASMCKSQHIPHEAAADWPHRLHDCLTQMTLQRRQALLHWLHEGKAPDF